jgi:hypothetical protein
MWPRQALASVVVAGVALGAAAGGGPTAVSADRLPGLQTTNAGSHFVVRPKRVLYTGDGTGFLTDLIWSTWTYTVAVGSGIDWIDNCRPDCARAPHRRVPARVRAWRPRNGQFSRLAIQDRGDARPAILSLCHGGASYYWC